MKTTETLQRPIPLRVMTHRDSEPFTPSPRTLILCFDGTSNEYDGHNTNVVKLYALLKKGDTNEQLCYYQPGIGTYFNPRFVSPLFEGIAKLLDEAFAWYLDAHVRGGYQFIMQNYRPGDKVCLFGFSRGAYTARALAGMIHKVGLLPRDNPEQIPFAYKLFTRTDADGITLAAGFKQTFSRAIDIEFVGVWDTVASVGIVASRTLPFISSNKVIKTFRHALSLDERRVKYQPSLYHRPSPAKPKNAFSIKKFFGFQDEAEESDKNGEQRAQPVALGLDDSMISESLSQTDVLEVWFAGCHSDVGGGAVSNTTEYSLSDITLRWMVREVVRSQCGVVFDEEALKRANIPVAILADVISPLPASPASGASDENVHNHDFYHPDGPMNGGEGSTPNHSTLSQVEVDALQPLHDQLCVRFIWWLLEIVPLRHTWQDEDGRWKTTMSINMGKGRCIPAWVNPNFHYSVKNRMADKSLSYTPKAIWKKETEKYVS